MYFNVLTVKGKPPPRYIFPCMLLCKLSNDSQNGRNV